MRSFLSLRTGVAVGAIALAAMVSSSADARPQYFAKGFKDMYPKAEMVNAAKCGICHGKSKKERNNYGDAFGMELTKRNERDETAIMEALKKAAAKPSAVEGMSFGALIEADEMPNKGT